MFRKKCEKVVCADGFTMSVQASVWNYCRPQVNAASKYESVEVGFPSVEESMLMPWVEDSSDPTGTVYAYVPVESVTNVRVKHGGMISGEGPPGVSAIQAS